MDTENEKASAPEAAQEPAGQATDAAPKVAGTGAEEEAKSLKCNV
jgi:hypothetical protein